MTFHEDDRDKLVVSSPVQATLPTLACRTIWEFNVELKTRTDYDFALAKFNEL